MIRNDIFYWLKPAIWMGFILILIALLLRALDDSVLTHISSYQPASLQR